MSKERLERLANELYYNYLEPDEAEELIGYIQEVQQENQKLKENWNELKKWLECMCEVSHLDIMCLNAVLNKMQEILDKVGKE